jgi:hypothetical protein
MNTLTARERIMKLAEQHGTKTREYREALEKILRELWQSGYDFGREQEGP